MDLILKRIFKGTDYTIGNLYVNGDKFSDTLEDTDRGLNSTMNLDDIKKIKKAGITAIPTGRYKITLNVQSPKFKHYKQYEFCDGYLPRLVGVPGFDGILIHCLTPDMEILTENGWQNLQSYKDNPAKKCYSYNASTDKIELVNVDNVINNEYHGLLYCNNGKRINYSVTDKHRMLCKVKTRSGKVQKIVEAKDLPKSDITFKTSGYKDGEEVTDKQELFYKLLMAVQADGYIINWSKTASQVRFHLKKDRKIERIKWLVNELGNNYKLTKNSDDTTTIILDQKLSEIITEIMNPTRNITNTKDLPLELLNLDSTMIESLLLEYMFWDGRYENFLKNGRYYSIVSTNTNTLNILQAMCTLCGKRSYIKNENAKNAYTLIVYNNQEEVTPDPNTYCKKQYDGEVWCLSNTNGTLIVRQNYRTMIIGNCGNYPADTDGCLLVGKNTVKGAVMDSTATFKKLLALMQEADNKKELIYITIE